MTISIRNWKVELPILVIAFSYFMVLINPLGWHMIIHVAPLYILFTLLSMKEMHIPCKHSIFCFAIFVLISFFSGIILFQPGTSGKIIRYVYELFILLVFLSYPFKKENVRLLIKAYIASDLLIAVKMLIQKVHIETDESRFSILNFGKIMDPNYLAALFIFPICYLFYSCIKNGITLKTGIEISVLIAVVLSTGSRGAFVSIAIACGVIFIKESCNSKKMIGSIILIIIFSLIVYFIVPHRMLERFDYHNFFDDSNSLRFNLWKTALRIFESSPFVGRGANSMINLGIFYGARINLMAHNTYLEILADYGMLGFVFWIVPFVSVLNSGIKRNNFLVVGILIGTYICAFFVTAGDSAFLWQNVLLCYAIISCQEDKSMYTGVNKVEFE